MEVLYQRILKIQSTKKRKKSEEEKIRELGSIVVKDSTDNILAAAWSQKKSAIVLAYSSESEYSDTHVSELINTTGEINGRSLIESEFMPFKIKFTNIADDIYIVEVDLDIQSEI